MQPKTIEDMSIVELESLAYRQIVQLEISQANLKAINAELQKRQSQPVETPEETPTKKK